MKFPNPIKAAGAFVRWIAFVVKARSIKASLVEDDTYIDRMTTCIGCDKHDQGQCLECTCLVRYKARLKTEACPLNHWVV